jgi:hypothetical protein
MPTCRQIDDIVKMKRNKMKKIVALVAVLFSVVVPIQAHGADSKALVIIDSYFDSKVNNSNVSCIVVATDSACTDVVTVTSPLFGNNINHGNAMVEVAKRQNPNIKIIALRSAPASAKSVADVTPAMFIDALTWVNNHSSNVGAVSFSRYFNHATKPCMPTTSAPYTPELGDAAIKSLIASLNSKGIQVFAATGNTFGSTKIDYPACLSSVNAVTAPGLADNATVKYSALLGTLSSPIYNFQSTIIIGGQNVIPLTTSSATSAVAAQYVSLGSIIGKPVKVNP